jgi:hypothetical protein
MISNKIKIALLPTFSCSFFFFEVCYVSSLIAQVGRPPQLSKVGRQSYVCCLSISILWDLREKPLLKTGKDDRRLLVPILILLIVQVQMELN